MRIYRRILSLGTFVHAHLPPYTFPLGRLYMRIYRRVLSLGTIHWLQLVIQCLSRLPAMDTSATKRSPQTMEVMIQKVAHLKTMLEAPTSNDALLGTLADLDGLGNIATDVMKATGIGN